VREGKKLLSVLEREGYSKGGWGLRLKDGYHFMKEEGVFFNRLYQMVKSKEQDPRVRKAEKDKLKKAYYLMNLETLNKIDGVSWLKKICSYVNRHIIRNPVFKREPTRPLRKTHAQLLREFQAQNAQEVILNVVEHTNVKYNSYVTNEEKWVAIKVELLRYSIKNHGELKELKNMERNARSFHMEKLAEKIKEASEKLVNEEKELYRMVQNLGPENYKADGQATKFRESCNKTLQLIWGRMELYGENGRTSFLKAYNKHGDRGKQSGLKNLLLSSQALRQEQVGEKAKEVIRSDVREGR
jgi:hypothetical protein